MKQTNKQGTFLSRLFLIKYFIKHVMLRWMDTRYAVQAGLYCAQVIIVP